MLYAVSQTLSALLKRGFVVVVAAGILARLVFVLIPGNALRTPWSGGSDTPAYVTLAQNIVKQRGLEYGGQPTAFRPPGYPLLLAAAMEFCGKDYVLVVRLLQFGGGVIIAFTCALIARRILDEAAGRATLVIALFLPTLAQMTAEILTETTATLLCVVFIFFLVRYAEEPHWPSVVGMASAVGLGALVRSNIVFLGCVSFGAILLWCKERAKWRHVALAVALPCALVSPWVLRNLYVFHGSVALSTQGGFAAAAGVIEPQGRTQAGESEKVKAAIGWNLPAALETNGPVRSELPAEPVIDRRCWQAAFRAWREAGWGLVPLAIRKLSYFWFSTDQLFWTGGLSRYQRALRSAGVFAYWTVLFLGLTGWLQLRVSKAVLARAFLMYALVVTLLHIPFNMNTRYRITFMEPLLVVLAGGAATTLARRWLARKPEASSPLNVATH
ncbi:MAG TPA: glycosyltransferase family 39 protein [Verrucomicrobiae bacterium]|nr:glycosyltransferase family 39 protein [Verrucomicrobiae bacterium]